MLKSNKMYKDVLGTSKTVIGERFTALSVYIPGVNAAGRS